MYFTDAYPIAPAGGDFFDPLMEMDTQLFVDPFLIFKESGGRWAQADDDLVTYFQMAFEILAGHQDSPSSPQYKKVLQLMRFPEPREFGLGFVAKGTGGAGTGMGFARRMVEAMSWAIDRGLSDLHHFEELSLLVERVGRDRISDITCNILKPHFIEYTQETCSRFGVPVEPLKVVHSELDLQRRRWLDSEFDLPKNPMTGGPVLLVPKRFLRELPSLNKGDWWDYVEPELRDDLNLEISTRLDAASIVDIAREHPDLIRRWSEAREAQAAAPYDVDRDPEGLHIWQFAARAVPDANPLSLQSVSSPDDLLEFIKEVNRKFKLYIEDQGGWRLLWNEDTKTPRRETSIQLLYKGVVQSYCQAYGVALDREVELGRGPVDFIFSTSPTSRILMEIKKMQNGDYWHGLESQLTSYMKSDDCSRGWFLAVRFGDSKTQVVRTKTLHERTREVAMATGFSLRSDWVDARWKKSASELKEGQPGTLPSPAEDSEFTDDD